MGLQRKTALTGLALTLGTLALGAFALGTGGDAHAQGRAAPGAPVERIVSIGGAVTETVFALGQGAKVVAVDTTSTYPAAANGLPKVGYARTLGAEAVLSLAPTLILASEDAGPPETMDHLRRSGVTVRSIHVGNSPAGVPAMIASVAEALGVAQRGATLKACVGNQIDAVLARTRGLSAKPRVMFLLGTSAGDILASGSDTRADAMIALAGGFNAVQGYRGYKPLTAEAAVAAQPEVLLLTSEGIASAGGLRALQQNAGLAATPALQRNAVEHRDSLFLLGFGPRTSQAVQWLATRLHPEIRWPAQEAPGCATEPTR
jgi:iron complex transport system substrate-binding protein